ncbi:MAG: acyl-CoA synthetase [Gemmatimonadetes bacterium]|nr:acyl-CoA synthetase [Gemmatimonadota bacterium]
MSIGLLDGAAEHGSRAAVIDGGASYTYEWLDTRSRLRAAQLLGKRKDLKEKRVAFLMEPGFEYVVTQWAIWRAGGIAVPLCPDHPDPELEYVIDDADVAMLVATESLDPKLRPIAETRELPYRPIGSAGYEVVPIVPLLSDRERAEAVDVTELPRLPRLTPGRRALILYTSGTTGRPKGVVTTHANLEAHMASLVEAWRWAPEDRILHVLPLHHTHGIVNALATALYAGATVEFSQPFDPTTAWDRLASGDITVFMAVPTIYTKLLRALDEADEFSRARWARGVSRLRLMVSGSAALPVSVFERWEAVTGHRLLERYGMTEIGMGLSNPYEGERRPGTVGQPLPRVDLRLVDPTDGHVVAEGLEPRADQATGEIQVRGPMVFAEYWKRRKETAAAFDEGWFRTGDEAVLEDGYYRILGRSSVDILKSGGYKISAVEIEELLRSHRGVHDCAVVGLPSEEWGERVAAAIVPEPGTWYAPDLTPAGRAARMTREERDEAVRIVLDMWSRDRLAPYKVPRVWLCVDELPRNAMGKVQKPAVKELFDAVGTGRREPR